MTVSAAYTALVREVRLANTGQPCGDSFIAGGLECRVGAGDAQRAGSRRTPERLARLQELRLQIKREQNFPASLNTGLTPEQLHRAGRLATRRETDENIRARRAAGGQAQRPAVQRPEPVAAAHYTVDVLSPRIEAEARAAQLETDRRAEAARQAATLQAAMDGPAAPADGVPAVSASPTLDAAMAATMGRENAARAEAVQQAIEITRRAASEADARVAALAARAVQAVPAEAAQQGGQAARGMSFDVWRENAARAEAAPAAAPVAQSVMPAAPAAPIPQPPAGWQEGDNSSRIVPAIQAAAAANDLAAVRAVEVRRAFYRVQQWHAEVVRHMEAQADPVRAGLLAALPVQPVFDTANAPLSHAYVLAVREAAGTGNLASVRAISPSLSINQNARDWQDAVIRHMEQGGTPAQAAASVAAPTPVAAAAQAAAPVAAASPVVAPPLPRAPFAAGSRPTTQRYLERINSAVASGRPSRILALRMAGSEASPRGGEFGRLRAWHQRLIDHVGRHGLPTAQAGQPAAPAPAPVQPAHNPPPAAPPFPTDRAGRSDDYPATRAFVARVNTAIATGDLDTVRAAGAGGGEPLSQHRTWHTNVVAHMEQQAREAALTPEARARETSRVERERVREAAMQAQLNPVYPVVIPPERSLSAEELADINRIDSERQAVESRSATERAAAAAAERQAMAIHAPAIAQAESNTRTAATELERANEAHRAALLARTSEVAPAREAARLAVERRVQEISRLEKEETLARVGKASATLTRSDGTVIFQPSDFVPNSAAGHNATYVEDASLIRHAGRVSATFGVPQTEVAAKIKDTVLSMMSDLPEKIGSVTAKWQVKAVADSGGGLEVSFIHPGMPSAITRSFSMGANGLSVYHGYFNAGDNKGEGISQRLFKQSIGAYERAGVKEIKVYAALSHGGYVWLRHGFVPDESDGSAENYRTIARSTLARLRTQGANLASDGRHTKPDTAVKIAKIDTDEKNNVITKDEATQKRNALINKSSIYNYKTDKVPLPGTKISQEFYDAAMRVIDSGNPRAMIRLAGTKYGDIKVGAEMFVGKTFHGTIRLGTADLDETKRYIMRNKSSAA